MCFRLGDACHKSRLASVYNIKTFGVLDRLKHTSCMISLIIPLADDLDFINKTNQILTHFDVPSALDQE